MGSTVAECRKLAESESVASTVPMRPREGRAVALDAYQVKPNELYVRYRLRRTTWSGGTRVRRCSIALELAAHRSGAVRA